MKKIKLLILLLFLFSQICFGQLAISAVFDGPLTGGLPKGIELYAIENIADLSIYGIGSANNGGGTDGEEFTFPAVSVTEGTYIYVASESTGFSSWFGFAPDYISSSMSINGDDAVELFKNGSVIDLFGDINVDGTGEIWEYLDSWALSDNGRSASSTFNIDDWSFAGANVWDDDAANTNATSTPTLLIGSNAPTPVELTSFTARVINDGVLLNWSTATEVNNYGFKVERASAPLSPRNKGWEVIGFVEGHGNSYSPKEYSYIDNPLASTPLSYRLKQIDTDGEFEYSEVRTTSGTLSKNRLFQNHPNPFNPNTEIRYEIQDTRLITLEVYNILGEKVESLVEEVQNAGIHKVTFTAGNLSSGIYFYRLKTDDYIQTNKMILLR